MIRALTISLLLFFLADVVGIILYHLVDWYELKKEMSHLLASGEFEKKAVTLTFETQEFEKINWIESNHEFYYKGKLFDIVSIMLMSHNKTKIKCIEDPRESAFFKHMAQLVNHHQSDNNQQRTVILSVFKFLSGLVFQVFAFPLHGDKVSSRSGETYANHYQFTYTTFLLQPPNGISLSI